jgi:hypothetical protein
MRRTCVWLLLFTAVAFPACRHEEPHPIAVEGNRLTLDNRTSVAWTGVEIWVNNHYRVTRSTVAAGQRLVAPLDTFVAGFGQRFDYRRQAVFSVEVTGTRPDGQGVKIVWGKARQH